MVVLGASSLPRILLYLGCVVTVSTNWHHYLVNENLCRLVNTGKELWHPAGRGGVAQADIAARQMLNKPLRERSPSVDEELEGRTPHELEAESAASPICIANANCLMALRWQAYGSRPRCCHP